MIKERNNEESAFRKKLYAFLKRHNVLFFKLHSGMLYLPVRSKTKKVVSPKTGRLIAASGGFQPYTVQDSYPDVLIFEKGNTIFLELKSKDGNLRPNQLTKFHELVDHGFKQNCFFLKPCNWEEFKLQYAKSQSVHLALIEVLGINSWMKENT